MSGPLAESIARKLFRPIQGQPHFISHHFHYGQIIDNQSGKTVDEVLIVLMKSPKTYTREDIVEIHCHGGYLISQKILELLLREGARMAQPGEFTRRAFLNGRIDLTQAEAVIDLIKARTGAGLEIANQQLRGWLYKALTELKVRLIGHLALIEAHIDFPEEELEPVGLEEIKRDLKSMVLQLEEWVSSYEEGRVFRDGVSCAIVGKTNVGKSSLLNVLLKEERAIVAPIPGTTRDVIEDVLNVHGIPIRLMDTAGLRTPGDFIEREGVRRAKERVADSDLVLLMLDGSRELDNDDEEILRETEGKKRVVVINKNDLPLRISLSEMTSQFEDEPVISISALNNRGIDDLKTIVYNSLLHRDVRVSPEYLVLANIRHKIALTHLKDSLSNALTELDKGISFEFIAFEIRLALRVVGELIGETATEEVLDRIFQQFCIGK